jgi:ubiquinone/menaquinone biosynthesis C-methylase UbiE
MDIPQNLFGSSGLAEGYATSRPPVHPVVIDKVRTRFEGRSFNYALDVGCGAGLSTGPLESLARHCIGIEPAGSMLQWTAETAPNAHFVVGPAEKLPFRSDSVDIVTAAGSLNYVGDLEAFFSEAHRVLTSAGGLVVYDFSPGRRYRDSDDLETWFQAFMSRYPRARDTARKLDPTVLRSLASGFEQQWTEEPAVGLQMDAMSYERYMMTETNVGYAVAQGTPESEIRNWCSSTLQPVFAGAVREVLFDTYVTYFSRT